MENNRNNESSNKNPEENNSKAMDSKREVEKANDEKIDQDFPGYPHYPAREDIMDQRNDYIREDIDVENLPNSRNATGVSQRFLAGQNRGSSSDSMASGSGAEGDDFRTSGDGEISDDDLRALDTRGDEIGKRQNISNEDLGGLDLSDADLDDDSLYNDQQDAEDE